MAEGGSCPPPGTRVGVAALWVGGCSRGREGGPAEWEEARGLSLGTGRGEHPVPTALAIPPHTPPPPPPRACSGLREGERQREG